MIDFAGEGIAAIASGSPFTLALVFGAGVVTSVGPCVAPRYISVAALTSGTRRPIVPIMTFVAGLLTAYLLLGTAAGALGEIWKMSRVIDLALGASLIAGGILTIWHATPHACAHEEHAAAAPIGGAFIMGAASAFIISPCCTPVIAAIIGTSSAIGKPAFGALLLTTFGLGHSLPLLGIGLAGTGMQRWFRGIARSQAPRIVAGGLMLALGSYYTVLA